LRDRLATTSAHLHLFAPFQLKERIYVVVIAVSTILCGIGRGDQLTNIGTGRFGVSFQPLGAASDISQKL